MTKALQTRINTLPGVGCHVVHTGKQAGSKGIPIPPFIVLGCGLHIMAYIQPLEETTQNNKQREKTLQGSN